MSETALSESLWPKTLVCYDATRPTAVENLALDEVLLNRAEADPSAACVRFWQSNEYVVVLGRSNRVETEVNIEHCRNDKVPVYRRSSGGGAVVIGPGCLCYSLVLPIAEGLRSLGVSKVTAALMSRTAHGLQTIRPNVDVCGTSDLVWNEKKFSGNAQRWLRKAFIHHGTLLYDFDVSIVGRYLSHPTREPEYRQSRRHSEFVANLTSSSETLKRSLAQTWNAVPAECPEELFHVARELAATRYSSDEWQLIS